MSKEAAAAILTRVYFERTMPANPTMPHVNPASLETVDKIGYVYAAFLGKLDNFAVWAPKLAKGEKL